jgi:hypothetical protein
MGVEISTKKLIRADIFLWTRTQLINNSEWGSKFWFKKIKPYEYSSKTGKPVISDLRRSWFKKL